MSRKRGRHAAASANDTGRSGCFGRFMNPAVSAHATRTQTVSPKTPELAGWLTWCLPALASLKAGDPGVQALRTFAVNAKRASRDESSCNATEKEKRDEVSMLATKMFELK